MVQPAIAKYMFKLLIIICFKYTNIDQRKKYYLADVEELDSPSRILLEKLHLEADKKRKFSIISRGDAGKNKM